MNSDSRASAFMKFEEELAKQATPEWKLVYIDYKALKKLIDNWCEDSEAAYRHEVIQMMHKDTEDGKIRPSF